jgi:hypothetical protein
MTILFLAENKNDTLNPSYNSRGNELKPDDMTTERLNKSNDLDDKSDFQTEQIDSPMTSKNLEVCDRDSEEWEGLSHKDFHNSKNDSPELPKNKAQGIEVNSLGPKNEPRKKPSK